MYCTVPLSLNVTALRQRIGVGVPLCAAGRSTLQLCSHLRRCTALQRLYSTISPVTCNITAETFSFESPKRKERPLGWRRVLWGEETGCGAEQRAVVSTVMNLPRVMKVCVCVFLCAHTLLSVPQQCTQCMHDALSIIIVGRSLSFANCISKTVSTVKWHLACYIGNSFSSRICRANYTRYGHSSACLMSFPEVPDFGGLRCSAYLGSEQ
jgi:hypothetical protein